eukprot:1852666-Prymnesium_polylepis.1
MASSSLPSSPPSDETSCPGDSFKSAASTVNHELLPTDLSGFTSDSALPGLNCEQTAATDDRDAPANEDAMFALRARRLF